MCFKTLCELVSPYPLALTTVPPPPLLLHLTTDSLIILIIHLYNFACSLLPPNMPPGQFLFLIQVSVPRATSLDNGPWLPQTHLDLSTLVLLLGSLPTSAIAIICHGLFFFFGMNFYQYVLDGKILFSLYMRWGEAQLCLTFCDPVGCNLLGFSVHGILQARILEWIAISFSRESSRPRDRTRVSHIGGRHFNLWATREAQPWSFGCTFIFPL